MPKLAPLDDGETFLRYANEATARIKELEAKLAAKKSRPIGGKAVVMGSGVLDSASEQSAAEKAYDARTNTIESELEDAKESLAQNKAKINSVRRNVLAAEDAAKAASKAK